MDSINVENKQTTANSAAELLSHIRELLQKGHAADALECTQMLRGILPKNIFIAGLQKQIDKLLVADKSHSDEAGELRSSLQPLIEKAFETTRATVVSNLPFTAAAKPATKSDREKAVEILKAQYFVHADNMTKKGDYESALAEVKRALLLDSSDSMANDYIRKLDELRTIEKNAIAAPEREMKTSHGSTTEDAQVKVPPTQKFVSAATLDDLVTMTKPDFDSIIAKTVNPKLPTAQSEPATTNSAGLSENQISIEPKRKRASFLLGSAFFILLAIVASYVITTSSQTDTAALPKLTPTQTVQPTNGSTQTGAHRATHETTPDTPPSSTVRDSLQSLH